VKEMIPTIVCVLLGIALIVVGCLSFVGRGDLHGTLVFFGCVGIVLGGLALFDW
jgi:hypothetical protein